MADEERLLLALEDSASTGVRVAGLRIANYAVAFVASILIARALGPQGRGLVALPMAFLGIAMAFAHVGLESANVYLASRLVPLRALWANDTVAALVLALIVWFVVGGVRVLVGPATFGGLPGSWLVVVFAQLPLLLLGLYWTSVLQLGGRFHSAVVVGVAGTVVQAAVVAAMYLSDGLTPFRVLALAAVTSGVTLFLLLGLSAGAGLVSFKPDRALLRAGIAFGLRAQVATLFVFLLLRLDQVLVERLVGLRELGLYALAVVLAELLLFVAEPFSAAALPHQVQAGEVDERRLAYSTVRTTLFVCSVVGVAAWIVAPFAIRLAYGADFEGAVAPFRWLLPGVAAIAAQRPLNAVVTREGRLGLAAALNAVALMVNVSLNLWLLGSIGVVGASIASTVTYVGVGMAYVVATRRPGVVGWGDLVPRTPDLARLRRAFARKTRRPTRKPGPPRAVLVIGTLDRGGTEGQVSLLAEGLLERGWEVTVLCLSSEGPNADRVRRAGAEVVVGGFQGLSPLLNPFPLLRTFRGIREAMRARHPDVVHTFLYWGNLIGISQGRRAGVPVMFSSIRSLRSAVPTKAVLRPWERRSFRRSDLVVCNSEAVLNDAIRSWRVPQARAVVVRNGVHVPRAVIPPAGNDVLVIANLIPYKGHDVLLPAFAGALRGTGADARLLLAGEGPAEGALRVSARALGIEGSVAFLGSVSDIGSLIDRCAFTVLPSRTEGMPNAVLESLAHARAVISTDVGGAGEALAGGGGIIVPPDDAEALGRAIALLLREPARSAELGMEGRRNVLERFGVQRMVDETQTLYLSALLRKGIAVPEHHDADA